MPKKKRSLKTMLLKLFFIGPSFVVLCIIALSFKTISLLMTNKIEITIDDNLNRFSRDIQSSTNNLNKVIYQFTDGFIGESINELSYTDDPYEKNRLQKQIREQIELITFTHNDLHVITYYQKDDNTYLFNNETINTESSIDSFPILSIKNQLTYYAPHKSIDKYIYNASPVISILKKVRYNNRNDLYVYIEANFSYPSEEAGTDLFNQRDFYIITDEAGNIIFSGNEDKLPNGTVYNEASPKVSDFYTYCNNSSSDYRVLYLVPKYEYNREKFNWINNMIVIVIIFLLFTFFSMFFLWKSILSPIKQAEEEIRWIGDGNLETIPHYSSVVEFDRLIDEIIKMKNRIFLYIQEEKDHKNTEAKLQMEKLLYQINPHFLMNTLNTIYWMSTMNGQTDIAKNIQALNKLLTYNLKHDTIMVTLREEIDALQQYLVLQKTRYDFEYTINCEVDNNVLNYQIPRFILQPLVENSIYHGLSDDNGLIIITILEQNGLRIIVRDNGKGIPKDTMQKLLLTQDSGKGNSKMGIGINYVYKILQSRYDTRATLDISSEPGFGTIITMYIPSENNELEPPEDMPKTE